MQNIANHRSGTQSGIGKAVAGSDKSKNSWYNKNIFIYIKQKDLVFLFLPALIYYIVFNYAPMYGLLIVFKDYRWLEGIMKSPWIGFEVFEQLFSNTEFWQAFRNTIVLSVMKLCISFPAPIILALLLNEVRNMRFKKIVQTITYVPHFLSWVVLGGVMINFLSPSVGIINAVIKFMGFDPVYFLGDAKYFRGVLVLSHIWKEIGWGTIVYLAALTGLNPELYEAAALDGADRLKQTIHVTLPGISGTIVIMFIFAVGGIVNDDFDQIFNLYNPAVYSVGDVMSTYIYRMGLENALYSLAAAAGLFKNIIAFALVIATNYTAGKFSEYKLW